MPSDGSERMDALSEAILRLLRRQEDTDRRLAEIEKALGLTRPAPVAQPAPVTPSPVIAVPATPDSAPPPPLQDAAPPLPLPVETPRIDEPRLETKLGLAWVNRIGAVTLALCVAFIFKYAVDNAWIGPGGRRALGVIAGLAALAAADYTWRTGQKVYAQGISGLGIAILYLSFYASFGFYHLIDPGFAFSLMALATAIDWAIALRYDDSAITVLSLLVGYASPLLLS